MATDGRGWARAGGRSDSRGSWRRLPGEHGLGGGDIRERAGVAEHEFPGAVLADAERDRRLGLAGELHRRARDGGGDREIAARERAAVFGPSTADRSNAGATLAERAQSARPLAGRKPQTMIVAPNVDRKITVGRLYVESRRSRSTGSARLFD